LRRAKTLVRAYAKNARRRVYSHILSGLAVERYNEWWKNQQSPQKPDDPSAPVAKRRESASPLSEMVQVSQQCITPQFFGNVTNRHEIWNDKAAYEYN